MYYHDKLQIGETGCSNTASNEELNSIFLFQITFQI